MKYYDQYAGQNSVILIDTDRTYVKIGDEMESRGTGSKTATLTESKVYLWGDGRSGFVDITAYTIEGYNYFQLLELAKVLNYRCEWDETSKSVTLNSLQPYKEPGSVAFSVNGIYENMSLADAEKLLGEPYRTLDDPAQYTYSKNQQFRFYGNYSQFTVLLIQESKVVGYLSNIAPEGVALSRPGTTFDASVETPPDEAFGYGYTLFYDNAGLVSDDGTRSGDGRFIFAKAGLMGAIHSDSASEVIMFELINTFRVIHDMKALRYSSVMTDHLKRNIEKLYVSQGYESGAGRNDAVAYGSNGVAAVMGWIYSTTGHRECLLYEYGDVLGVAAYKGVMLMLAETDDMETWFADYYSGS